MKHAAKAVAARPAVKHDVTLLTDQDLYLFNEGTHIVLADTLGAHPLAVGGVEGTLFAV